MCIPFLPSLPDAPAGVSAALPPGYDAAGCEPGAGEPTSTTCLYGGKCEFYNPTLAQVQPLAAAGTFTSAPYSASMTVASSKYFTVVTELNDACAPTASQAATITGVLTRGDLVCCCAP